MGSTFLALESQVKALESVFLLWKGVWEPWKDFEERGQSPLAWLERLGECLFFRTRPQPGICEASSPRPGRPGRDL